MDNNKQIDPKLEKLLSKRINVTLVPEEPEELNVTIQDLEEKARFLERNKEKGFVNEQNGSSISLKEDGQISLVSSKYAQYKIHPAGRASEISLESEVVTNRHIINADEIIINNHKLNPALYEFTDFKFVDLPSTPKAIIGNLTLSGSVLVKAWEPNLKRYMMIRRPCRLPMFGNMLNVPEMHSALQLTDPTQLKENILAFSEKGYQVNAKITDKNSFIGKEGINRGSEYGGYVENISGSGSSFSFDGNISYSGEGYIPPIEVYKYFKSQGYNDIAVAGILGNIQQEYNFCTKEAPGGIGIFQIDFPTRREALKAFAASLGKSYEDGGVQMAFAMKEIAESDMYEEARPNSMNACGSAYDAAVLWDRNFERSGEKGNRFNYAEEWYAKIKNGELK